MNRTKRLLATILLLLTTVAVCLLRSQSVRAWGEHGHCIRAQAAAQKLPTEMPPFFRSASDELAYLNPEPDRWQDGIERRQDGAVNSLASGAEMLRDMWWTAWVTSDGSRPVIGNAQAGRVDAAAKQVIRRIDVGNTSSYTDSEGRMWSPDTGLFTPERAFAESRGKPQIAGAADPTIYHTYRGNVGGKTPQAERILSFEIPVGGHRKVDVRLYFVEIYWGAPGGGPAGPGKRLFDVEAEGRKVLEDFDITKASGAALTAIVVPIKNVEVSDGKLTLVFRAKKDFAAVSAIEVLADK